MALQQEHKNWEHQFINYDNKVLLISKQHSKEWNFSIDTWVYLKDSNAPSTGIDWGLYL